MSGADRPASPYVGLNAYEEKDAPFFFGREAERQMIIANLRASRLTLLYGPSGVGKSSVLRAGVVYHLRQLAQQELEDFGTPGFAVVFFNSWADDPITGLAQSVRTAISQALQVESLEPVPASRDLSQIFAAWAERVGIELLIILDQFEEYFLYRPKEEGEGTFAAEFPKVIKSRDLPVRFLLSLREDALSKLDRFKASIPSLFDLRLQIEHLDSEAARTAIVEPISQYNKRLPPAETPYQIEEGLVEAVLKQVKAGEVALGGTGRGILKNDAAQSYIETPYLQLVMTRIWKEEVQSGSRSLREETLKKLGGATKIVQTHLDTVMESLPPKEQDTAASFFHYLVTPVGTKIAHTVSSLAVYTDVPEERLSPVLYKLSSSEERILRPLNLKIGQSEESGYEVYHDALAPAILDWRARYVRGKNAARLKRVAVALATVFVLGVGAVLWALQERGLAEERARLATSRALATDAINNLHIDPELSVLLALEAVSTTHAVGEPVTPEAVDALHQAVHASRVRLTLPGSTDHVDQVPAAVAISPDGRHLFIASTDGTDGAVTVKVWDVASGQEKQPLLNRDNQITEITFSPDGRHLATASADGTVNLRDTDSGREVLSLSGYTSQITEIAFSPDGRHLVTAREDGTVNLWDTDSGRAVFALAGHTDQLLAVACSPDGKFLATAREDGTVKVWDVASGQEKRPLLGRTDQITEITFSPDGRYLATANGNGTVKLWDVASGQRSLILHGHTDQVLAVTFSPDGKFLATASYDQTVKLWDTDSGRAVFTLAGHTSPVNGAAFSLDGISLVTASMDGTVKVWEANPGYTGQITRITFSPDGRYLATASADRTVNLWDTMSGRAVFALAGHTSEVQAVTFSPKGRYLATASADGAVNLWDTMSGQLVFTLAGHTRQITGITFSPDGRYLATAREDGTVNLWDTMNGRAVLPLSGHTSPVIGMVFSADGKGLFTASVNGTVKVWDVASGQEKRPLLGRTDQITKIAFSPKGRYLATASADRTVKVWDADADAGSDKPVLIVSGHTSRVIALAFIWNEMRLVAASLNRMFVYPLELKDLIALARMRVTRWWTVEECQRYLQKDKCPSRPF